MSENDSQVEAPIVSTDSIPATRSSSPRRSRPEQLQVALDLLRWLPIAAIVGVMAGSASALLLVSLEWATRVREQHLWIVALLPVAGFVVGLLYWWLGSSVEAGNNLILEEVHDPNEIIPIRMTPLILLGTIVTHLFGGSAGREGTAIQTGASLADQLSRPLRMGPADRRILLMMGISAGFASVFGTPLAGAIFGIEVLAIGALSYEAIAPCIVAAFLGEMVTRAWGVHHTIYTVTEVPTMSVRGLLAAMAAGICFGLMAMFFARTTHAIKDLGKRYIVFAPMRPFVGGVIVAGLVFAIGTAHTARFLGLGVSEIVAAFHQPLPPYDFAVKSLLTSITLGMGFKGGEVTPLFFIGATMGNALSHLLPLPATLLAGMGFVAVFAGAANTPVASTLMAVELFGAEAGAFAGITCVVSYLFSGHCGIYTSQRLGRAKHRLDDPEERSSLALEAKKIEDEKAAIGCRPAGPK